MITRTLLGVGIVLLLLVGFFMVWDSGPPSQPLSVPAGLYEDVLRFPNGEIWLAVGPEPSYHSDSARYYLLQEERFVDIPLPQDPRCPRQKYAAPRALPNGTLGFTMRCGGYWPDQPMGQDSARLIVAYDLQTETFAQIIEAPMPDNTWIPSWNPQMSRGVMNIGSLLGTIVWVTPTGMEPMTITVGTAVKSWSLAENLRVMEEYGRGPNRTDEVGIARNGSWSPDGRLIAFWVASNVIGRTGMSRAYANYTLYLLNPDTLELQPILENVKNTTYIVWSPNSQWLTFIGDRGQTKASLWIISVDGNIVEYVDKEAGFDFFRTFRGWNWLNDQELIATKCLDPDCQSSEVLKYDVSEIVNRQ